jgi:cytochrome c-type biogenesis protein CcmH/NrfG
VYREQYECGTDLIREERWQDTAAVFESILSSNTHDGASWYNLAYAYWRLGRVDNCITAGTRAVALQAHLACAYLLLGYAYLSRKELNQSEKALRRALKLGPHQADPWLCLGSVLWEKGVYTESLRSFQAAEGIHGRTAESQFGIGKCHEFLLDNKAARAAYERALEMDPGNPVFALQLARSLINTDGRSRTKKRAERLLREVLRHLPENSEARTYLALSLNWRTNIEEAIHHLKLSVDSAPDEPNRNRNLYFLGLAYGNTGDLDTALDTLLRAQELFDTPQIAETIRNLKLRIEEV